MAKKITYYSQIINGESEMDDKNCLILENFLDGQPDGCIEHTARRAVKPKSQKQLGAHFGLMMAQAIAQANDNGMDTSSFLKELVTDDLPSGIGLTTNFLKEIFYCLCPMFDDKGKRITLSKSSTVQASKHLEDCTKILAAHGIYIDSPDPNWKEKEK